MRRAGAGVASPGQGAARSLDRMARRDRGRRRGARMTTTYLSYRIAASDLPAAIGRVAKDKPVAREVAYWQAHIDKVQDIDSFVADKRLFSFAMKAFGLSDMQYAKAFMTKLLKEGVAAPGAMANKLTDQRYRDFAKTFDFATYGTVTTSLSAARTGVVDRYLRQTLEEKVGAQSDGARLALYFQRKAATITSPMSLLADPALLKVTRVALDLPEDMSRAPLDNQVAMIKAKFDVASLKDPAKLDGFLKRFCAMNDLAQGATSPAVSLAQGGASFGVDTLMAVALLKTGG